MLESFQLNILAMKHPIPHISVADSLTSMPGNEFQFIIVSPPRYLTEDLIVSFLEVFKGASCVSASTAVIVVTCTNSALFLQAFFTIQELLRVESDTHSSILADARNARLLDNALSYPISANEPEAKLKVLGEAHKAYIDSHVLASFRDAVQLARRYSEHGVHYCGAEFYKSFFDGTLSFIKWSPEIDMEAQIIKLRNSIRKQDINAITEHCSNLK